MPDAATLAQSVRVIVAPGGVIESAAFDFPSGRARFAVALVSPYLHFAATAAELARIAAPTPLVAVPTAGELAAAGPGDPLYRASTPADAGVVLQIFPPDLLADVAVRTVPLGDANRTRAARIAGVTAEVAALSLPFAIDVRDTVAVTLCDGSTGGEDVLMEAAYSSGRLPCVFIGGSAGRSAIAGPTPVFDGQAVRSGEAVLAFLKLQPSRRYGVFKSQNFDRTEITFVAVDADPSRREVSTLLDPDAETARPATAVLAERLGVVPEHLTSALAGHSFGIDIAGETFVRSVSRVDPAAGTIQFYCDVHPGDELILLKATDFAAQTCGDIKAFLADKPPALGALVFDCILRRLDNAATLAGVDGAWPCPVAGFSSFGELLGINLNHTLTALVFFDGRGGSFRDDIIDRFAVHYARWQNAFTVGRLRRFEIINRLRAETTRRLTQHLGASPELACEIEGMLTHGGGLSASLENIRATIAREVEAERRARHAEQQLAEAVESISEGLALYDADDRLVLANSRIHAMFPGIDNAFVVGRTFEEIVRLVVSRGLYGYQGEELERFVAHRLAAHQAADGTATLQHMADGTWLINRENRTRDGGIVGTRTDVTELKRREAELEKLKLRYELILGAAGDGIVRLDEEGRIRFANPAAATTLGVAPETLKFRCIREAMGAPALPVFPLQGIEARTGEAACTRADGSAFTAEFILTPMQDDGRFAGAVLVFRDITLRKRYETTIADQHKLLEHQVAERTRELSAEIASRIRVERALEESRTRLMGITSSLFEGVLLVDGFGVIVFANPSAHRWIGVDTLLERLLDDVIQLESDDAAVAFANSPFSQVIAEGITCANDDATFLTADGRRLAVAFAAAPLDETGRKRIAVISFRGIEALKEAQRETLQISRLASVGQLAAGVAHEINTPIQYVGDNLRYIQDTFSDIAACCAEIKANFPDVGPILDRHGVVEVLGEYPEAIEQALHGVSHVTHIVRSMKDFSHPGGKTKIGTDINAAIDSTITVCRNEWKHVAKLVTDLDPGMPKILCYPSDIHQVLLNLIVNAAHALGETGDGRIGEIKVTTRLDGPWAEIRIADDGPGVPKALRDRIFDPFFTTKAVGKGTGQGLSICQDIIVKKHGGKLFLDETVAVGASFVVRLPLG